jgi:oxepin-CoA hydrolase / 3-oxo-5,6-dehydrosuberyl-CoA semialdehyde dehydrogenase
VISAAAGLFVDPAPGPVLANYGLEGLRFTKPVFVGDTIKVRLTCKQKTAKEDREDQVPQGVVAWDVEVSNQDGEAVAIYTILTLVARTPADASSNGKGTGALADAEPVRMQKTQPGDAPARVS